MSVASKRRRRARRGGIVGHLGRVAALLTPPPIPVDETAEQAFARLVVAGAHVLAHPETISSMRAKGSPLAGISRPDLRAERGKVYAIALSPATFFGPAFVSLTFCEIS